MMQILWLNLIIVSLFAPLSAWCDEGHLLAAAVARLSLSSTEIEVLDKVLWISGRGYPEFSDIITSSVWADEIKLNITRGRNKLDNISLYNDVHFIDNVFNPEHIVLDNIYEYYPLPKTGAVHMLNGLFNQNFISALAFANKRFPKWDFLFNLENKASSLKGYNELKNVRTVYLRSPIQSKPFVFAEPQYGSEGNSYTQGRLESLTHPHPVRRDVRYPSLERRRKIPQPNMEFLGGSVHHGSRNSQFGEKSEYYKPEQSQNPSRGHRLIHDGRISERVIMNPNYDSGEVRPSSSNYQSSFNKESDGLPASTTDNIIGRPPLLTDYTIESVGLRLRLLIHVLVDLHQPLHVLTLFSKYFRDGDQGGNLYATSEPGFRNLHFFWDSCGGQCERHWFELDMESVKLNALKIRKECNSAEVHKAMSFETVVEEIQNIAKNNVYTLDFSQPLPKFFPLTEEYKDKTKALSQKLLCMAGGRLGIILKDIASALIESQYYGLLR